LFVKRVFVQVRAFAAVTVKSPGAVASVPLANPPFPEYDRRKEYCDGGYMFFIPRVNVIASDEGFEVEIMGMTGIKYTEQDRVYFVDSEVLSDPYDIMIIPDYITIWGSTDRSEVSSDEKDRITNNILRAFTFRQLKVLVR